ncbi:MAG: TetR/AcrR family transcriptional regulator [Ruminococcus sp.]|nr:TetR/AcrR family transcriptional regulator [Ruminococcus sp.]
METREKILLEAVKLFASAGFGAVTVDRIASAVGIKAPSLYKHFKSKRDIFQSILSEMERRDAENAESFSLPADTAENDPEGYQGIPVTALLGFCREMFVYWTEDEFASAFRRMLTVEQYRSEEMNRLYHQYLGEGPLQYTADLLGSYDEALTLYAPMHLLYGIYDSAGDKQAVTARLEQHLKTWYKERTGGNDNELSEK